MMQFKPGVWLSSRGEVLAIDSVGEAALFLAEWPEDRRDEAFFDAAHAATLATAGGSVIEARAAFRNFCAVAGILAEADANEADLVE